MKGGSHTPTHLPYTMSTEGENNSLDFLLPGGDVVYAKATQQMKLGDCVFKTSVVDTFDKSATPANYATMVGVVVGGRLSNFQIIQYDSIANGPSALIGNLVVANAGQEILIMIWGTAYVIADAALATIGTKLTGASTTAGRVGSVGAASGNFVGAQLDVAAGAGSIIRLAVNQVG